MGAYEQELYIRRGDMGDVARQTKALYCTEYHYVDTGATSIESRLPYPRRSPYNLSRASAIVVEETVDSIIMPIWYREKSADSIVLFFFTGRDECWDGKGNSKFTAERSQRNHFRELLT